MDWKLIFIAVGIGAIVIAAELGYIHQKQVLIEKKAARILKSAREKDQAIRERELVKKKQEEAAPEGQRPSQEIINMIEDIRVKGQTLPHCPLIFPLKDKMGRINALGSFLSYLAMEQATYLPESIFDLPNAGTLFQNFRLFDSALGQYHEQFSKQLAYMFATPDNASGTLVRAKTGYTITLSFTGSHPLKKYKKKFTANQLHSAPGWMASRLHDWVGFKPNARQAAFLKRPVFLNDKDLERTAFLESLIRQGGYSLVNQWDNILAKNSKCHYLVDRWLGISDFRERTNHLDMIEPLVRKYPDNSFYKFDYVYELYALKKYDEALKLSLEELQRDNDNPDWYRYAAYSLEGKGYNDEAVTLLKNWTQSHPENPNAWIQLAQLTLSLAWEARGTDWTRDVPPKALKLFKKRVEESLKYAQKAVDLTPHYGRAWGQLVAYGNAAELAKETMKDDFGKVLRLDPNDYEAYTVYMDYLNPKWNGSLKEMFEFARKFNKRFPALFFIPCAADFHVLCLEQSEAGLAQWRKETREKVKNSPYWKDFAKSYGNYLTASPGDLGEWKNYLAWAALAGKTKPVLDLAKKISGKDKELRALYPYVVLASSDTAQNGLSKDSEKKEFVKKPKVFKERVKAYQTLLKLDPHNWDIWNRLAWLDYQNKKGKDAKKAFRKIGNHWVAEVWSKDDFEKAKKSSGVK